MYSLPIEDSTSERSWWSRRRWPIATVQDFHTCSPTKILEYFDEICSFSAQIMRERIAWLDSQNIEYKMHYSTSGELPDMDIMVIYHLYIEFSSAQGALAYKLEWSDYGTIL